ncbi:MAG: tetratricopeptide repeat protein [Planctomycetaceae bacterium]
MRSLRILQIVVVVEAIACLGAVVYRAGRPAFPVFNAAIVDRLTAENLEDVSWRLSPDHLDDWNRLGETYLVHGSYRQAEACYRHAEMNGLNVTEVRLGRGISLERLGRTSEAIEIFRSLADEAGSELRAEVWYRIGRNLLREERPEQAELAFREVLEFVPAKFQAAKLLIRADRADEAEPLVDELLRLGLGVMEIDQLAGRLSRALGDEENVRKFRERIERDPNRLTVGRTVAFYRQARQQYGAARLLVEADAKEKANRLEEAEAAFERVLTYDFSEPLAVKVAALNLRLNRPAKSIDVCHRSIRQGGASAAVLDQLASAHMALGDWDEAIETWERSVGIALRPSNCAHLAAAYRRRGENDRAARLEAMASFARGVGFYRIDKIEQAEAELQASYEREPSFAPTAYYLGRIALLRDKPDEAKSFFEKCLQLDPGHGRAYSALMRFNHP